MKKTAASLQALSATLGLISIQVLGIIELATAPKLARDMLRISRQSHHCHGAIRSGRLQRSVSHGITMASKLLISGRL